MVVVVVVVHSTTLDILLWQDTIDKKMGSQVLAIRKWRCVQFVFVLPVFETPRPKFGQTFRCVDVSLGSGGQVVNIDDRPWHRRSSLLGMPVGIQSFRRGQQFFWSEIPLMFMSQSFLGS